MDVKRLLLDFLYLFLLALVVVSAVVYLWGMIFGGAGAVKWAVSFPLAVILGAALAWSHSTRR